jgi:hypothetical protein
VPATPGQQFTSLSIFAGLWLKNRCPLCSSVCAGMAGADEPCAGGRRFLILWASRSLIWNAAVRHHVDVMPAERLSALGYTSPSSPSAEELSHPPVHGFGFFGLEPRSSSGGFEEFRGSAGMLAPLPNSGERAELPRFGEWDQARSKAVPANHPNSIGPNCRLVIFRC